MQMSTIASLPTMALPTKSTSIFPISISTPNPPNITFCVRNNQTARFISISYTRRRFPSVRKSTSSSSLPDAFSPFVPKIRSLKSRLAAGETLYGLFLLSSSPTLAEIAGLAGYDYVVVDMEHGPGGISDALPCLRALASTGTAAVLRLPETSASWAKKALDLGRPFEYLRLTSLGVIGALVKVDDPEVISFLLQTEIIPLCLRTMEMGSELSKTVATFIVQKILLDDVGLRYICATAERFFAVGTVLANMVVLLAEQPSTRLLKHIIRCYLRLSENPRACEALQNCIPEMLKDGTFNNCLRDDLATRRWLQQLLHNISGGSLVSTLQPTGFEHMLGS